MELDVTLCIFVATFIAFKDLSVRKSHKTIRIRSLCACKLLYMGPSGS